jgi:hypothetical protein
MKLLNFLKKETKSTVNSNIQKLEKDQLSKVIGGADSTETTTTITQEKKGINAINH